MHVFVYTFKNIIYYYKNVSDKKTIKNSRIWLKNSILHIVIFILVQDRLITNGEYRKKIFQERIL
jgi:hypothetical protein